MSKAVGVKKAFRLVKKIFYTNLYSPKGINLTPLLVGPTGIGKSTLAFLLAENTNSTFINLDGTTLKEGEIPGMPVVSKDEEFGGNHVKYEPHWSIKKIQNNEKTIIKNISKKISKVLEILDVDQKNILDGTNNQKAEFIYNTYFESLTGDQKLKLIKAEIIKTIVVMIDEINRGSREVMQELMNFLLSRNVSGYNIPWWTFIMAAQNPSGRTGYSVSSFGPAQQDRVLVINMDQNIEEFIDWGMESKRLHPDVIDFLISQPEFLKIQDGQYPRDGEAFPSPRSWEMCSLILFNDDNDKLNDFLKFDNEDYTSHEKASIYTDGSSNNLEYDELYTLIKGKIGDRADRKSVV